MENATSTPTRLFFVVSCPDKLARCAPPFFRPCRGRIPGVPQPLLQQCRIGPAVVGKGRMESEVEEGTSKKQRENVES